MTPFVLLDELKTFIEKETKDLLSPVMLTHGSKGPKERAAQVFVMRLKEEADKTNKVPYVLLQFIKSEDKQEPGKATECRCWVRIIAVTYAKEEDEGALALLNLLTRIRLALLREGIIGRQFVLESPLEAVMYPDTPTPYHLGEMMSVWRMKAMESEVNLWQV